MPDYDDEDYESLDLDAPTVASARRTAPQPARSSATTSTTPSI